MKHCLNCHSPMKQRELPGYWLCTQCGLFFETLSLQATTQYQIFSPRGIITFSPPQGTLLILKELPL